MNIETTIHFTCYNDYIAIKNCVESFLSDLSYDRNRLEIIIVDNGSKDKRIVDFIKNLNPKVASYQFILNEENNYPSCMKFAKIQARRIAKGKYFIDVPDDHLFILKDDWIGNYIRHVNLDNSIGCICYCAQPHYRYLKKNNQKIINEKNNLFFKSLSKGYADYHLMSKQTYVFAGEYLHELGRKSEGEYMERLLNLGFYRNIPFYPSAIINDDNEYKLIKKVTLDELSMAFPYDTSSFVSNESLTNYLVLNGYIKRN